jgi:drug/metabolite transporter (DMT)-like permease
MSTDQYTGKQKALALGLTLTIVAVVIGTGLLLREYGPGNMGTGFLVGAALALAAGAVTAWRVTRRPGRATTFERAWTQTGDERDDAVLTRALAVLGLLSVPLTGAATIAIGLGAAVEIVLTLLLAAEILVGAVAFAVVNRRN